MARDTGTNTNPTTSTPEIRLRDAILNSPTVYSDTEVDLFFEWITEHSNRDSNNCYYYAYEVRQDWDKREFESLLALLGKTPHDLMFTIMVYAKNQPSSARKTYIDQKFSNGAFVEDLQYLCYPTGIQQLVGEVLAKYPKCQFSNTCIDRPSRTDRTYLDTTNPNNPNYIEPTPFYKTLWFWILIIVVLMFILIASKK